MQDRNVESAVLGILANASIVGLREARSLIDRYQIETDDFFAPAHQILFTICRERLMDGNPLEPVGVYHDLRGDSAVEAAGGQAWLSEMLGGRLELVPGAMEGHVKALKTLKLRRQIGRIGQEIYSKAQNLDVEPDTTLAEASSVLASMTRTSKGFRPLSKVLNAVKTDMETTQTGEHLNAIPTGLRDLDMVIGGLQRAVLTVVGADTGVGKSSFFATVVENVARSGTNVGVFSLEDEGEWLGWRFLARRSGLNQHLLRFDKKNAAQLQAIEHGHDFLKPYADRIFIDDRTGLTADDVAAAARDMITNYGVEVIVVDHLGELNLGKVHKDERHDLKMSNALAVLRDVAKAYKVAVVAGSQVTVPRDMKPGAVPNHKWLKNSTEIANKARCVLMLGRDPGGDTMKICVAKQTNGDAGVTVEIPFHKRAAMLESA